MNSSAFVARDIGEFANKSRRKRALPVAERCGIPAMLSDKFTSFLWVLSQTSRGGHRQKARLGAKVSFGCS
jgi:hypothetical protein